MLKSFRSDIQDGLHGSHLEILQTASVLKTMSMIEPKLDGRHWNDIEIHNCYNYSVPISKMAATLVILKIFKPYHFLNGKLDGAKT